MKKHIVFISSYHKDDQCYKDKLLELNKEYNIFDNYSVPENDIDDNGKTRESIRKIVRDKYIKEALASNREQSILDLITEIRGELNND